MVNADEGIAEYVSRLPSYDYNMVRFTDFIRPYLLEKSFDNEKYKSATGYKDK